MLEADFKRIDGDLAKIAAYDARVTEAPVTGKTIETSPPRQTHAVSSTAGRGAEDEGGIAMNYRFLRDLRARALWAFKDEGSEEVTR